MCGKYFYQLKEKIVEGKQKIKLFSSFYTWKWHTVVKRVNTKKSEFFICDFLNITVNSSVYIALNDKINEQWIAKDMEGGNCGIF